MPNETQDAVNWALQQDGVVNDEVIDSQLLVDKVREYFNTNSIEYSTFSFDDLLPYL